MMKKNGISFVRDNNVAKTFFNKIKNSLKKPSKKAFGKIGLFLIFGMIILNLNLAIDNKNEVSPKIYLNKSVAATKEEMEQLKIKTIEKAASAMGFKTDGSGTITDVAIGKPTGVGSNFVSMAFKALLMGVLWAVSELAKFAGLLLDVSLKQDYFTSFVDNEGVYDGWVVVRDVLNLFFMLLLLFSAFATIFQVEKYHLKKMIVMLVVMALLVNFSFPITRFVIDFSNSAMYFLLENSFPENVSFSGTVNRFVKLGEVIGSATGIQDEFASIVLNIVLTFIVFVTIFAFAINLIIRILAFVILIIVSPAGFVFAFFPGTKNIADDWWSALFKYAFMGPVMAFFLYLAVSIFDGTNSMNAGNSYLTKDFVRFIVPIAFLWMGLIASQKFGGSASGAAMNFAKKTGNNIKSYGQKAAWGGVMMGATATGVPGALKSRWTQFKDDGKSKADARAAIIGSKIGVKGAKEKDMKRRAEEYKKNLTQPDELKALAIKGDAAAAYRLAEDKDIDQKTYDEFMDKNKDDSLRKAVNSKTKQARMDLVAVNTAETTLKDAKKLQEFKDKNQGTENMNPGEIKKIIIEQEMGKLGAEDYANQDWKAVSEQVDALTKKGNIADATVIKGAVLDAFNKLTPEAKNEMKKRLNGQKAAVLKSEFSVRTS